jgi:hypothetical protein
VHRRESEMTTMPGAGGRAPAARAAVAAALLLLLVAATTTQATRLPQAEKNTHAMMYTIRWDFVSLAPAFSYLASSNFD